MLDVMQHYFVTYVEVHDYIGQRSAFLMLARLLKHGLCLDGFATI